MHSQNRSISQNDSENAHEPSGKHLSVKWHPLPKVSGKPKSHLHYRQPQPQQQQQPAQRKRKIEERERITSSHSRPEIPDDRPV
eukprot:UN25958